MTFLYYDQEHTFSSGRSLVAMGMVEDPLSVKSLVAGC